MQNPVTVTFEDANTPANSQVVNAANPLPVGGGVASGVADSGNPVKVAGKYNATLPTFTDGQRGDLQIDNKGGLFVHATAFIGSGADAISNTSISAFNSTTFPTAITPLAVAGSVFNGTSWDRETKANATSRIVSAAATTNATSGKASAGTVYSIECVNVTAALKYLKLYNKASAPTVGTDTPVRTIALSPSNAKTTITFPTGYYFSTGIAYALTGAAADGDSTALAAGDVVGLNIDYS